MTVAVAKTSPSEPPAVAVTRGGWSWAFFEVGRMPILALITGSVFVPYFATTVVGDPVEGQAQVASFGKIAGLVAAFTAPLLGAAIDHYGPRKPWLGAGSVMMALLIAALWWTMPGGRGLPIAAVIAILVGMKVLYGYTETLHNSMLVRAAAGGQVPALSGLSLTIGNLAALLSAAVFLLAFALPGTVDSPWVLPAPLFGLQADEYENVRFVGPFVAGLVLIATLPLLLFTPDAPPTGQSLRRVTTNAALSIWRLPATLRGNRNAATFLLARMIYADGTAALTLLGGAFVAGVMKWSPTELLLAGVLRGAAAALGAMTGAYMDRRLDPRRSLLVVLVVITAIMFLVIGTTPDRIAFFWAYDPSAASSRTLFPSTPDLVHLGLGAAVPFCIVAIATSSRSLLAQITPVEQTGAYFGLYALAGSATAWLAPSLIEAFTRLFNSQQAGFAPVLGLFVLGFVLLLFVRPAGESSAKS